MQGSVVFEVILIILYVLNAGFMVGIIFVERKNPSVTLAWLLMLTFLPYFGMILYLFFGKGVKLGFRKKMRLKTEADRQHSIFTEEKQYESLRTRYKSYLDEINDDHGQLIKMNYNMCRSMYTANNSVQVFTNGREKFDSLFIDIESAKYSINIEYFIIRDDKTGQKLIDILARKASEGVVVKLMYDALGSRKTPLRFFNKLKKAGGHVKQFYPILLGSILYANYRNHRKIVVIDGVIGYVGGMNIGDEYAGEHERLTPWRDTHLRIVGAAVHSLQYLFFMDWHQAHKTMSKLSNDLTIDNFPDSIDDLKNGVAMQIVHSGPDAPEEEIKRGIVRMILTAKRSVYIQTPYFIPDDTVLEAIQSAATAGLDVKLILPKIPDHKTVYYASCSYIESVLPYGVKVYFYKGFMHSKMVIADDEVVTIGSTNIDIRSFSLLFEVNTFIYDKGFTDMCNKIFQNDLANSVEVTEEIRKQRGVGVRILESIFRLFAPLF